MFDTPNFRMAKGGSNFPEFLSQGMNFFNIKKHCLDFSFVFSAYRAWGTALKSRKGPPVLKPFSYTKATGKKEGINSHEKNTLTERIFTMAKGLVHWHLTFQSPLLC
jgi:hypothetical protein